MSAEPVTATTSDEHRSRILGRQLALLSPPTLSAIVGLPLWAASVCWIMSGAFPALGAVDTGNALLWFAGIAFACLAAFGTDRGYRRARADATTFDPNLWAWRYTLSMALLSASWASLVWVFWVEGNDTNQLSLTVFVFCGIMNGIISRMNMFATFLFGTGLAFLILWSKFLTGSSDAASIFSVLLPLWFIALTVSVKAASTQVRKNIEIQIANEFLTQDIARARDEAERDRQSAQRANQMKSAFLANMSHELRTPMNAILGFSEIISAQAFGSHAQEKYRDYAADINSSGRHLLSMINDLLDLAKVEAGKLELDRSWIDGHAAVRQSAGMLKDHIAAKGLELRFEFDPAAARIYADERSLHQITLNLVSNAVKYTDKGAITVSLYSRSGAIVLAVADSGCGIPAEHIGRIFEPFEQVDNRYAKSGSGTGLGLTLVRALAELHGGSCKIESTVGQGTRVEVCFPQAAAAAAAMDATRVA